MPYCFDDLVHAYKTLGVQRGGLIYVTSHLFGVADYEERGSRALIDAHYRALRACLGEEGTLVVATSSTALCNTDTVFDIDETSGTESGAFSEYVRTRPGTYRSFHPFVSYVAEGPLAEALTTNTSRYCYGPETPEGRMVERNALHISVGLPPQKTCSTVHHVEQIMAVPYRYTKEFIHPVRRNDTVSDEPFYMHVWYRDIDLERDSNIKLFAELSKNMKINKAHVGRGAIYSYSMQEFVTYACRAFADDPYIWCKTPPSRRPYQK